MCDRAGDRVSIILDVNFKSEWLKNLFRNYFFIQRELKYFKIVSYIYCRKYRRSTTIEIPNQLMEKREFIKILLEYCGLFMEHLRDDIQNDRELALIAVKSHADAYWFIGEHLKAEVEIILAVLRNSKNQPSRGVTEHIFTTWPEFSLYEDVLLNLVEKNKYILNYTDKSLLGNKQFMMKAVYRNEYAIEFANELIIDEEMAMVAMLRKPLKLDGLFKFLRSEEFVIKYIERSRKPVILEYVDISIRKNRTIVLESVKKNSAEFRFASKMIRGYDREIVLCALRKDGDLLRYVEEPLKYDKEIVEEAIGKNPLSLRYADRFRDDTEIVQLAISKNRHAIVHASKRLQDEFQSQVDDQSTEEEWSIERNMLQYWNDKLSLSKDKNDAKEAIRLGFVPSNINYPEIYKDRELMLEAIKKDAMVLLRVGNSMDLNRSFVRECIQNNYTCLLYIRDHFLLDKEFILDACLNYSTFEV
ncbi:predicted protein [Naegleria gruberi]|uniref:Predicted protein n=1 Tax=Naegleria gruberi TaxID=5762 RepID=D2VWC4_NAEGR|nr:uncharacterized protein NAEGRDRAFT_52779 [Naegleria gruberi]EFC38875.1 predicted protein [Naegleria gruberi]|eukprot:XP_002671619.1 predicted protein [Naegleria gruberi strain NEG-M]